MPTIKRKVEMNLPQLIEWAWENGIEKRSFKSNDGKVIANFEDIGHFITDNFVSSDVTFTVEVEEEITEDTKLELVERFIGGMGNVCYTSHRLTIKECLKRNPRDCTTTHFYIENDNRDLVLIWRDGKLVE